jgi:RNA polymerase-binding transcription factor DksA
MKMYDCGICYSAGSVNKWGYCEICGEQLELPRLLAGGRASATGTAGDSVADPASKKLTAVGRDAA